MGLLVDGKWVDRWYDTDSTGGAFERSKSMFRNWVTADGSAGPTGDSGFKAEPGRYHLYVSLACPWAHRALIMRKLKQLENAISVSVVHWFMGDQGWTFQGEVEEVEPDPVLNADYLHQIYTRADPKYTGRVTTPTLWDRDKNTIVSNESADIIRMFNSAFSECGANAEDFYPQSLRSEIDDINTRVYDTLNNGVYKAGFATEQKAYEEAVVPLFETLDWLETLLSNRRWVAGGAFTEADIRLFTTLVRFDAVYHGHFKCNLRRLVDFSHLWDYTRDVFQWRDIGDTVDFRHIKNHYYRSHDMVNPTRVVPLGPAIDFHQPHGRQKRTGA